MKSADLGDRHDAPGRWRLYFSRIRAVVVEGLMRAGGVVSTQQTSEMPFVDHDDVIKAFPSDRADDAFGEGILPGRSRGDEDLANPQAFQPWRGKSLFQIGGALWTTPRTSPLSFRFEVSWGRGRPAPSVGWSVCWIWLSRASRFFRSVSRACCLYSASMSG